jgi:probable rRNA maturation factor
MINVLITDAYRARITPALIEETVQALAAHQGMEENELDLSIVIESSESLHELNWQFRAIDAPTDVLSFPSGEINPETGQAYLGDVIISFPQAEVQAQTAGHSITCELRLLIVHGVLHLLGYDHATLAEEEEMWVIQRKILQDFGCSAPADTGAV